VFVETILGMSVIAKAERDAKSVLGGFFLKKINP
jgi:hypothetical protein